jgi:hypothetical protein
MPETYGVRSTSNFIAQWALQEAEAARGDAEPVPEEPGIFNASDDPDYTPPAGGRRSPRSEAAALAAVADALGVDVTELDDVNVQGLDDIIQNDLNDPLSTYNAIAEAQARDGGSTWRAEEQAFRLLKGITGKRKSVPPSRTPEARRTRHLQTLVDAGRYPDLATAERMTPRRPVREAAT